MAVVQQEKPKPKREPPNVDILKKQDFGNEKVNASFKELQERLKLSLKNRKDRDQIYKSYIDLAAAFYRLFRYDEAETCCWKHLNMAREKKFLNEEQVKTALTNLGCILRQKMLYDEALVHYKEAAEIAERIEDTRAYARILNNMANIYECIFDFDSAIECHEKRIEIATDLKDVDGQIKASASLGSLNHLKGELRRSILYYEKVVINIRMKLVRQQAQAMKKKEAALKEAEDRENGIFPETTDDKEFYDEIVDEQNNQQEPPGIFGFLNIFAKK